MKDMFEVIGSIIVVIAFIFGIIFLLGKAFAHLDYITETQTAVYSHRAQTVCVKYKPAYKEFPTYEKCMEVK